MGNKHRERGLEIEFTDDPLTLILKLPEERFLVRGERKKDMRLSGEIRRTSPQTLPILLAELTSNLKKCTKGGKITSSKEALRAKRIARMLHFYLDYVVR